MTAAESSRSSHLPGEIYPVLGADHYLNPSWDIRPLLRRILLYAARSTPC